MDSDITIRKRPGPKPSGVSKVAFFRRVPVELVPKLLGVLGEEVPAASPKLLDGELVELRGQLEMRKLKSDSDDLKLAELAAQVANLQDRLEKCAAATDDQKAVYWRSRAFKAEGLLNGRKSEFDQG